MTTLNTIWQQFTLQNLLLYQWRNSSFLYQLTGFLHQWRQGSWLLQWGEPLGALLITIIVLSLNIIARVFFREKI